MSKFPNKNAFISLDIIFGLASSENPDEMPHHVTFHLGFHYLPKYKCTQFNISAFFFIKMAFWLH